MKEVLIVCGAVVISVLLAIVIDGGPKPQWLVEKMRHEQQMNEIVARQPGGLLSDFEPRW